MPLRYGNGCFALESGHSALMGQLAGAVPEQGLAHRPEALDLRQ
jgi:hypothetical protein